jgi:hypothetical protein
MFFQESPCFSNFGVIHVMDGTSPWPAGAAPAFVSIGAGDSDHPADDRGSPRRFGVSIRRLAQENQGWEAPKIHVELQKLDFVVSERSVRNNRAACSEAAPYRYAIFARDATFGEKVAAFLQATGLKPKRTSIQAPWQNGVADDGLVRTTTRIEPIRDWIRTHHRRDRSKENRRGRNWNRWHGSAAYTIDTSGKQPYEHTTFLARP